MYASAPQSCFVLVFVARSPVVICRSLVTFVMCVADSVSCMCEFDLNANVTVVHISVADAPVTDAQTSRAPLMN